jgi:sigma-B regulation protein RsbU (phosphoserine phosphatase)
VEPARIQKNLRQVIVDWFGLAGFTFIALFVIDFALQWFQVASALDTAIRFALLLLGLWLAIRLLRLTARSTIWRLRNRLLVTYLFISAVPILLVIAMTFLGGQFLSQQLVVYLVASELDRRVQGLNLAVNRLVRADAADRPMEMESMVDMYYRPRYPGIEVLLRQNGRTILYPRDGTLTPPLPGWNPGGGILRRQGKFYLWRYDKTESGDVTVTVPLTGDFLAQLIPGLGLVGFGESISRRVGFVGEAAKSRLPAPLDAFDKEFDWFATVPTLDWDHPNQRSPGFLAVRSRASAILSTVFNRTGDVAQGTLILTLAGVVVVFFIVEIISLLIGLNMTRAITGAVHNLYEGTVRVRHGDFAHHIEVKGNDQLAELSQSFNEMTANIQKLLVVAQEKERLQSEVDIAREVQSQLFPRAVPTSKTLRLTAACQPARSVSGDYYDYETIREKQIGLAIGDVAGKGISAALLMATLQSSLRTQLQDWRDALISRNGSAPDAVSTSHIVNRLNLQLHAHTLPEKFATFCLGVYDETTGAFTYTNAGHLPPILIRKGTAARLEVNGTVVGAFSFSTYDESRVDLEPGDLLVFFTDGVTEPENAYGEMFGEDRLIDLVTRNADLSEDKIVEMVLSSVRHWTASDELQDDMTILLARRL